MTNLRDDIAGPCEGSLFMPTEEPEVIKTPITQLSRAELEAVLTGWGERPFRVKQILKWVYEKRIGSFQAMTDLRPSLREALAANYTLGEMELVRRQGSEDTTQKLLFRLSDRRLIECVLIPASVAFDGERSDRQTHVVNPRFEGRAGQLRDLEHRFCHS